MTRFYGRLSAAPWPGRQAAIAEATRALRPAVAETSESQVGRNWVLGVANPGRWAQRWHDDDAFAVVHGVPRIHGDDGFAAAARERGLPAACAAQYARLGPRFLESLRGQFALVIHLGEENRSLLAVDRIGIRSMYYSTAAEGLAFSTDLAALRRVIDVDVDPQAIYNYLYFHDVPAPGTVYKQLGRLPAGGFLERRGTTQRLGSYWEVEFQREDEKGDFESLKREFLELLRASVRRELESSSPIGCFLSGGTDSSTLSGLATQLGGEPARTYSIGFDQQGFDEIEYARIAARRFGTRQREYYLRPDDIVRIVPRLAEIYGQPFGNSSVIPTYCCAEMARGDGVEALIAGDGGDELFGGNQRYATQQLFSYYTRVPAALRRHVLDPMTFRAEWPRKIVPLRKLARYIEQASEPMPERLQTYNYLNMLDRSAVFEGDFLSAVDTTVPSQLYARTYERAKAENMLNKMMALDLEFTLTDSDLPKVTLMADAAGVMTVFPFLQEEVVGFASRLPATMKVNRLRLRYFFKKALADLLPEEIIRKKKHGFGMPFGDWLFADPPLRELAFDSMSSLRSRGILRPQFIDELCDAKLREHPNYFGGFMWILMILESWFEWQAGQSAGTAMPAAI